MQKQTEASKVTTVERRLLREREACVYLGVSRSFLARARCEGSTGNRTPGPPFIRLSDSAIRYALEDLNDWIQAHRCAEVRA